MATPTLSPRLNDTKRIWLPHWYPSVPGAHSSGRSVRVNKKCTFYENEHNVLERDMRPGHTMDSKARTHSEGVYNKVRIEILACRYRPGARLKIQDLCEEHQVSNGAVREALSRLASEGLVILEP